LKDVIAATAIAGAAVGLVAGCATRTVTAVQDAPASMSPTAAPAASVQPVRFSCTQTAASTYTLTITSTEPFDASARQFQEGTSVGFVVMGFYKGATLVGTDDNPQWDGTEEEGPLNADGTGMDGDPGGVNQDTPQELSIGFVYAGETETITGVGAANDVNNLVVPGLTGWDRCQVESWDGGTNLPGGGRGGQVGWPEARKCDFEEVPTYPN
jgi:hypothetical protein